MRVLVFGMTENPGGVESFLINYYRHIDRNKIQWDFLCNSHNPVAYEDELVRLGGRCFHITARSTNRQKYRQELETVFREHSSEWDAIWVNVCSLANIDYLKIAKKYGIKRRIIHSHNSQNMDSKLRGLLHKWNKQRIGKTATDFWACSEDAANWFYSGDTLQKVVVIHNAIDIGRMRFDEEKRKILRIKYGWQDKYIIGNVGRLHFQKNQSFALDVFAKYRKKNQNALLVLVGQGEDEQMLKEKASQLRLKGSVYFARVQSDIQAWLSSFDMFLFPSVFEGLGIAGLEAEANGLPTIASQSVIPQEVKINDNFFFIDLHTGAEAWSEQIEKASRAGRAEYNDIKRRFIEKGYDIDTETGKLEKLLLGYEDERGSSFMDKYQIVETTEQFNHAGTKATADISAVAEKMGFKKLYLKMRSSKAGYLAKAERQAGYYIDWNKCYQAVTEGSVVLLQHPFHYPQLTREKVLYKLKREKKIKVISVVHDVEELRAFRYNDYYKREFEVMLDIADSIIVHNQVMLDWFVERGVLAEKLVNLKLFDYLIDSPEPKLVTFERSINIAGNLDVTKCGYIGQLGQLDGVKVNLYGPNFDEKLRQCKNVDYHGSFPVDEIPNQLNKGFGLVWDGESIDGCKGLSGQYLRYNNPHKMSLYIASGLPIVIWKEAAQARFVEENGIGICVERLYDLKDTFESVTREDYLEMCGCINKIRKNLVTGMFAKDVIGAAINLL